MERRDGGPVLPSLDRSIRNPRPRIGSGATDPRVLFGRTGPIDPARGRRDRDSSQRTRWTMAAGTALNSRRWTVARAPPSSRASVGPNGRPTALSHHRCRAPAGAGPPKPRRAARAHRPQIRIPASIIGSSTSVAVTFSSIRLASFSGKSGCLVGCSSESVIDFRCTVS